MKTLRDFVDAAASTIDSPECLSWVSTTPGSGDGVFLVDEGDSVRFYTLERGHRYFDVETSSVDAAIRYLLASTPSVLTEHLPSSSADARDLVSHRATLDSARVAWELAGESLIVPDPPGPTAREAIATALDIEVAAISPVEGPAEQVVCRCPADTEPTTMAVQLRDAFVLPVAVLVDGDETRRVTAPDVR
ncbi:hypothetical protein [Halovivax cerinus]|uniref:Uncharacterized protein n=1 Tax=Halovivax cerinus TaxID=1487865 RepID=A0ABD5NIE8_9EURY|nr:hypothetical protein [Halovivax cerinus]